MSLEKKEIKRKFCVIIGNNTINVADPNPLLSIETVKEMFTTKYPELLNSKTVNKGFIKDELVIQFTTVAGTKG